MIYKKLRRLCKQCEKPFLPDGKFCRLCNDRNTFKKRDNLPNWLSGKNKLHLKQIKKYKLNGYLKLIENKQILKPLNQDISEPKNTDKKF